VAGSQIKLIIPGMATATSALGGGGGNVSAKSAHTTGEAGPRTWMPLMMSTGRTTKQRSTPRAMPDCVNSSPPIGAGVSAVGTTGSGSASGVAADGTLGVVGVSGVQLRGTS
jgi:hypothetical protein